LIVTALGQEENRVKGLELGADDYLAKPFSLKELVARIRALLRRTRINTEDNATGHLKTGPLSIDMERHEVRMAGRLLELTRTEFALLKCLAQQPGRVFTRDELITALWGEDRFVENIISMSHPFVEAAAGAGIRPSDISVDHTRRRIQASNIGQGSMSEAIRKWMEMETSGRFCEKN
jgi:hypothetical protein